jgi:hypothetical protein
MLPLRYYLGWVSASVAFGVTPLQRGLITSATVEDYRLEEMRAGRIGGIKLTGTPG